MKKITLALIFIAFALTGFAQNHQLISAEVNNHAPIITNSINNIAAVVPGLASNPSPADSATNVDVFATTDNNGNPTDAITLSWDSPTTGGPVTGYEVYWGSSPNDLTLLGTTTSSPVNITDVNYSTTYYWKIVPYNSDGSTAGASTWSFTTESSSTSNLPGVVTNPIPADLATNVDVFATTDNNGNPTDAITLSWDSPTTGGPVTGYEVYWGSSPNDLTLLGTTTSSPVNITDVNYSTTYYWKIVPYNNNGDAIGAATWSFTTEADPTNIPDPAINPDPIDGATNVALISTTNNDGDPTLRLVLEWEQPTTGGNVDGYRIFIGSNPNDLNELNTITNTSASLINFIYSSTYYWKIIPFNSNGDATNVETWSFTTEVNPDPIGIATNPTPADGATNVEIIETTTPNGNPAEGINLSWEEPNNGIPIGYDIYLGLSPNSMSLIGNTTNTSFVALNLNHSSTYYWVVEPYNSSNESPSNPTIWSFVTEDDLNIEQFEEVSFSHYLNNNLLNVESNSSIKNINIYNILGQQVISQKVNSNDTQVNIAPFKSGVYLVQVEIKGQSKSFKIVKK